MFEAGRWMAAGIAAVMLVIFVGTYGHIRSQKILFLAAFFCMLWGAYRGRMVFREQRDGILSPISGCTVEGIVLSEAQKETTMTLVLRKGSYNVEVMMEASLTSVKPGDRIQIHGDLYPLNPPENPGGYNEVLYYKIRGIDYRFTADSLKRLEPGANRIYALRGSFIGALGSMVRALLPEKQAGIVAAMLTGERAGVDADLKAVFQDSGIAHIIAISGLHIQILSNMLQCVLNKVFCRRRAVIINLLLLWCFCFITGGAVSTIRACIMLSFRYGAPLVSRMQDDASCIAAAAFCILLYRPLYIMDAGFQLSFGACIGLFYGTSLVRRQFWIPMALRKRLMPGIAVSMATTLILLYHFRRFCPYSILLNLLVVPLMGIVVIMSGVSLVLYRWCPAAAAWGMGSVYYILELYEWLSRLVLKMPYSILSPGSPTFRFLVLYYVLGILLLRMYRKPPAKRTIYRKCKWVLLLLLLLEVLLEYNRTEVAFLSVGQGDCAVISVCGKTYIVDAGPQYESVLKTYLLYRGIRRIDGVFLSHMDSDHSEGVRKLLQDEDFEVQRLYLPDHAAHTMDPIWEKWTETCYWKAGDTLSERGIRMRCLAPVSDGLYADQNAASMVLHIYLKNGTILMTGDMDQEAEALIMEDDIRCDILKVAHHGSKTSSSEEFLRRASPRAAWISCSEKNLYGHPHPEVLDRLDALQIPYICSWQSGALLFCDGHMEAYKEVYKRRWMD